MSTRKELQHRLDQLQRAFIRRDAWRHTRRIWTLAAIAMALLLLLPTPRSGWLAAGLGLVAIAATVVACVQAARRWRSIGTIVAAVEHAFPHLEQRLLTAWQILRTDDSTNLPSSSLIERLFTQVTEHDRRENWGATAPTRAIRHMAFGAIGMASVAIALLLVVANRPAAWRLPEFAGEPATAGRDLTELRVEPGDAEVERDTPVIVTAKFAGKQPEHVTVHVTEASPSQRDATSTASELTLDMVRQLDDPIFATRWERVTSAFRYHVEYDGIRSREYTIRVFDYPKLVQSDATVNYPKFTELPEQKLINTRRLSVVEGSEVLWQLQGNKPIAEGWLEAAEGTRVPLAIDRDQPQRLSAPLVATATGRWKVVLRDQEGRANRDLVELVVTVRGNEPPKWEPIAARDVMVSPLEELAIAAKCRDDFRLVRAGVRYGMVNGEIHDVTLAQDDPTRRAAEIRHLIELEMLQARPDQLLTYSFWAEDRANDGSIRRTASDMYFAEVRPFEIVYRQGAAMNAAESAAAAGESGAAEQMTELLQMEKEIVASTWNIIRREIAPSLTRTFKDDVGLIAESQQSVLDRWENDPEVSRNAVPNEWQQQLEQELKKAVEQLTKAQQATNVSEAQAAMHDGLQMEQSIVQLLLAMREREMEVARGRANRSSSAGGMANSALQQRLQELELDEDENRYESANQPQSTSTPEESTDRERRQIVNRLRDLARRQQDLNREMSPLQSPTEEKPEANDAGSRAERLKRLREEQQELVHDADELAERMDQSSARESLAESSDQLRQTREELLSADQALQQGDASQGLAQGTRAEEALRQMADQLRSQSASQFQQRVESLQKQAASAQTAQKQLLEQMDRANEVGTSPGLRSAVTPTELAEAVQQQRQAVGELLRDVEQVVQDAEPLEPLLARELYEAHQAARENDLEQRLAATERELQQLQPDRARQMAAGAREGLDALAQGLERAGNQVVGSAEESWQRASRELEQLAREIQQLGPSAESPTSEAAGGAAGNDAEEGERGTRSTAASPNTTAQDGANGGVTANRFTGEAAEGWIDRLCAAEELMDNESLRTQAAQIRERVRALRRDARRHAAPPKWEAVEDWVATPLDELRRAVDHELARHAGARQQLVPIDHDPVPSQYQRRVQRYYERLGEGEVTNSP